MNKKLIEQAISHLRALLEDHSLLGPFGICDYLQRKLNTDYHSFTPVVMQIMKKKQGYTWYAGTWGEMTPQRIELTKLVIEELQKELEA